MLIPLFYVLGLVMGGGWMYTSLRSRYHRGCGDFLASCAELIEQERFDPVTVMRAFHREMPWQDRALLP